MNKKIPWWNPTIGSRELELLRGVLEAGFPNEGPLTIQFQEELARRMNVKHVIAVTSGTAALFLSLKALGIGNGDDVLVPDVTFIATVNAIDMAGANPVLVDVDPDTLNIDPDACEHRMTPQTRAIIPVHVSGRPAKMEGLLDVARRHGLAVVEDAAEALLSKHNGHCLGTIGDTGCFSLSPAKTITTGQGGLVVTNRDDLRDALVMLKDQGRPVRGTGGDDLHAGIGYNFKYTDLQAAVGLGQLDALDDRLRHMRRRHELYQQRLTGLDGFQLLPFDIAGGEVPQWTDALVEDRDALDRHLRASNVDARRFWHPIHQQPAYLGPDKDFPNSTRLCPKAIWLPSAYTLSDADIGEVCDQIHEFLTAGT